MVCSHVWKGVWEPSVPGEGRLGSPEVMSLLSRDVLVAEMPPGNCSYRRSVTQLIIG